MTLVIEVMLLDFCFCLEIFNIAILKWALFFYFPFIEAARLCSADNIDSMEGWTETNKHSQHGYNSSSNSNSSSISTISSSSSDSDYKMTTGVSELEADADSLNCRQSGLSSNNQLENDCPKLVCIYLYHRIICYLHIDL